MANIHHIHHTFGLGCAMPPHLAAPHLTDPLRWPTRAREAWVRPYPDATTLTAANSRLRAI